MASDSSKAFNESIGESPPSPSSPSFASGNPIRLEKSILNRFNAPTLERKHSSGDLHSRLKTRKILGVGETDNGDIHRSKIAQVLGHNDHLYLKLPKGYWIWHVFVTTFLLFQGAILLITPKIAFELGLAGLEMESTDNLIGIQYYGAGMLGFSYVFWKLFHMNDKSVTRTLQFAIFIFFSGLLGVDILYALRNGIFLLFQNMAFFMVLVRLAVIAISSVYCRAI